jgi:phage recombination protein Bet
MTKQLVKTESKDLITFTDDQVDLIKRQVAKGATNDELAMFLYQARRTGLDPLAKQIYFQKYDTKKGPQVAFITGIDGYRLTADRTGLYVGNDEPVFEGKLTATFYNNQFSAPAKATVTVWKLVAGERMPFTASAYWNEYYPGEPKGFQWKKMPHVMLGKCAEAAALRKAFPADLSGVYIKEEMDQADNEVIEGEVVTRSPGQDAQVVEIKEEIENQSLDEANEMLIGKIEPDGEDYAEKHEETPVDEEEPLSDTETAQAWLADKIKNGNIQLGLVGDSVSAIVPFYNDWMHVKNALTKEDEGFDFPEGFKVVRSQKVTREGAFKIQDWLIARKV